MTYHMVYLGLKSSQDLFPNIKVTVVAENPDDIAIDTIASLASIYVLPFFMLCSHTVVISIALYKWRESLAKRIREEEYLVGKVLQNLDDVQRGRARGSQSGSLVSEDSGASSNSLGQSTVLSNVSIASAPLPPTDHSPTEGGADTDLEPFRNVAQSSTMTKTEQQLLTNE
jgi:hypothetical protein